MELWRFPNLPIRRARISCRLGNFCQAGRFFYSLTMIPLTTSLLKKEEWLSSEPQRSAKNLLTLLRFLCPSVFQGNRPIENQLAGRAVFIGREAGEALELITQLRQRAPLVEDQFSKGVVWRISSHFFIITWWTEYLKICPGSKTLRTPPKISACDLYDLDKRSDIREPVAHKTDMLAQPIELPGK